MKPIVCLGELLIDFVPLGSGDLHTAESFAKAAGGAPANVAVGLARLGVASAFMGQVGDDAFGHFLAATLGGAGVDTAPLRFTAAAHTALAFVSLAADGDRSFLFYRDPSADMLFAPADVDAAFLAAAAGLHFGSISMGAEASRAATLHALALARAAGLRISYDPNLRPALWPGDGAARDAMRIGFDHAELVKLSEEEVRFMTGEADLVAGARALWRDPTRLVTVTLGARGCLWLTASGHGHVPGFAVPAVDTTGAGDAFMAGILAGLGEDPEALGSEAGMRRLCRLGNAMGALTASGRGAILSLPHRKVVDALLAAEA